MLNNSRQQAVWTIHFHNTVSLCLEMSESEVMKPDIRVASTG